MDQIRIGEFLKELRKEKGLTQEQLAEQFNVSRRSVSRWETGSNLPDLSILVELAEFYDVDIKEIIDGARKSEMMNEEVKEVAFKMADYAVEQKSRFLIWIRRISLVGVVLMAVILGLQTFNYEARTGTFLCYVFSVLAFVVMVILSLYTNGLLEEDAKRKKFVKGCKIFILIVGILVLSFIMKFGFVLTMIFFMENTPYEKAKISEQYRSDLSELFVFPEDTKDMIEPTFVSSFKTGFFDTDGYMILQARYDKEDYDAEVKRLSSIECTVDDITIGIKYDEESYALPAYVAIDGFDYEYEYALLDEKNHTITYIILSYPEYVDLSEYEEYLKLDADEYKIEDTLNQFSIYERYYKDGVYIEYSDEN